MEHIDPEMARRVWQRVQGQSEPVATGEDLRPLMCTVQELAAVYRKLWANSSGRSKELLKRLQQAEAANYACLKGIQSLRGGRPPKGNLPPMANEPAEKALEKCYHRTRRLMAEFTARSAESEFGAVFYAMGERERELCAILMELVGSRI